MSEAAEASTVVTKQSSSRSVKVAKGCVALELIPLDLTLVQMLWIQSESMRSRQILRATLGCFCKMETKKQTLAAVALEEKHSFSDEDNPFVTGHTDKHGLLFQVSYLWDLLSTLLLDRCTLGLFHSPLRLYNPTGDRPLASLWGWFSRVGAVWSASCFGSFFWWRKCSKLLVKSKGWRHGPPHSLIMKHHLQKAHVTGLDVHNLRLH